MLKTHQLLLLLFCLLEGFTNQCFSQGIYGATSREKDVFLKENGSYVLTGSIRGDLFITVNLEKKGTELSGSYYYGKHYSSIPIKGTVSGSNFEFSEYDSKNQVTGTFIAKASGDQLIGKWKNGAGTKEFDLNLTYYSQNSLKLTPSYFSKKFYASPSKKGGECIIEATYLYASDNRTLGTIIDSYILKAIGSNESSIQQSLEAHAELTRKDFTSVCTGQDEPMCNWNWGLSVIKDFDHAGIVSMSVSTYSYAGGAHPIGYTSYFNFDTRTNKSISLKDIFKDGTEQELEVLMNKAYSESEYAGTAFAEPIAVSNNFYFTRDGIVFFYNQYEMAPYAVGSPYFEVKFSEMNSILRTDAPIQRLRQR